MTESARRTVLITGPTGAVGPAVARAAVAAGYAVRTLSRHAPPPGLLPDGVDMCSGDIRDRDTIARALEGVDRVLHLAALLHIVAPSRADAAAYESVNAASTAAFAEAAASAGVSRFVLFSTIAVYGDNHDVAASEDTPPAPDSEYARTKLQAEHAVLGQQAQHGSRTGVVLRLAAVYGPRVRGNYRRLAQQLAKRRFVPIGDGRNRRTLVFVDDVARAAMIALEHPAARGGIFNVTDGTFHEVRDIVAAICTGLHRSPPKVAAPLPIARAVAATCDSLLALAGRAPRFRVAIDKYTCDVAIEGTRLQRVLGFSPSVSLIDGWQRTIVAMRAAGEL